MSTSVAASDVYAQLSNGGVYVYIYVHIYIHKHSYIYIGITYIHIYECLFVYIGVWLLEHGVHAVRLRHRKDWGSGGDPEAESTWRNFLLRDGAIGGGSLLSHVLWDNAAETRVPEIAVCRAAPKTWS